MCTYICPQCGCSMGRNQKGLCKKCQLRNQINELAWQASEIWHLLPMSVRAKERVKNTPVTVDGDQGSDRELLLLYRKRDALRKRVNRYKQIARDLGFEVDKKWPQ